MSQSHPNKHTHEHTGEGSAVDLTRLERLLPHWIEHNTEHADEFQRWAERTRAAGRAHIAEHLKMAVQALREAVQALQDAQEHMGGRMPASEAHPHPHPD